MTSWETGRIRPPASRGFYRRHAPRLLTWCARRGLSAHDAADVTADVFVAALHARHRFEAAPGESAEFWLQGIAFNIVAGRHRRSARERAAQALLRADPITLTERDVADYAQLRADVGELVGEITALPADQRSALVGRRLDGAAYGDLASKSGVSEQVIRRRVSRAVQTLRRSRDGER